MFLYSSTSLDVIRNGLLNPVRILAAVEPWPDGVSTRRKNATRDTTGLEKMIDILQFQPLGFGEEEVYHWDLFEVSL